MSRIADVFLRIAEEVVVLDRHRFAHARYGTLHPNREIDGDSASPVLPHLWRLLYLCYHAGDDEAAQLLVDGGHVVLGLADWEEAEFVEELRAANCSTGYVTAGWTVTAVETDRVRVRRNGLTLCVERAELSTLRPPHEPVEPIVGAELGVRFPPELTYSAPGWWIAIGEAGLCSAPDVMIARLYFTLVDATAAPPLMAAVTELLNGAGLPFEVKVVNSRRRCTRRDAFVVYLRREDWHRLRDDLAHLVDAHAERLRDDGPPFALRLAPGWSLADEPLETSGTLSFGQHRCLLVAEGLVEAHDHSATSTQGRLDAIAARFARSGLDITRPHASLSGATGE